MFYLLLCQYADLLLGGKSAFAILFKMRHFFAFSSRNTQILYLDANFALLCISRKKGYSVNFSCRLVFPNIAQREIAFFTNFSRRLFFFYQMINSVFLLCDVDIVYLFVSAVCLQVFQSSNIALSFRLFLCVWACSNTTYEL